MSALTVYLNGDTVGRLEQNDDEALHFAYFEEWINSPDAVPLSRSLPLQSEVFEGKKARAFFAGILPEERPRQRIAEILGISEGNDFAMLERIGGECAGAVSLFPEGLTPPALGKDSRRKLTQQELSELIAELHDRPLMAGEEGLRLSLAGAQDKLPVIVGGETISLPFGDTPSTHILKPEPDRFPGLAANEVFCMSLAQAVGLNAPDTEYREIGGRPCILVERYDRKTSEGGHTIRLHQEDFCQALGYPPERKYQAENGPAVKDCISLIQDWSTAAAADIPAFIGGLIFIVLIGNADAHGKNYSFLYHDGEHRLAPFYDLVSTIAWPRLTQNLAMKIGGCDSVNAFGIGDWKNMAKQTNLGWPILRERLAERAKSILTELDSVAERISSYDEVVANQLRIMFAERANKMLNGLATQKY